jgi:hypothetical protein
MVAPIVLRQKAAMAHRPDRSRLGAAPHEFGGNGQKSTKY